MFGSKIISSTYYSIKNIPNLIRNKILGFKNYYIDCKYKLAHLKETNYELGLDHLYNGNLNDALLRFNIVDKLLTNNASSKDPQIYYWLGWTHFLKKNYESAIRYLEKSNMDNKSEFINFLQNYRSATEIPKEIWHEYRDLTAKYYTNIFHNDNNIHLPYSFVTQTIKQITELPDDYSILELGSNVGMVGYEIQKRFPEKFTLTGIEISRFMNDLSNAYYRTVQIYDQIYDVPIKEFLTQNNNGFDVILSFCALSFTNNLQAYFDLIYLSLNEAGYFSLCLPISHTTKFSVKRAEFTFNLNEINAILKNSKFTILISEQIILAETNKYCIIVCKK